MEHDLVRTLLGVGRVALAPIVADSVGEDVSVAVEGGAGDGSADSWVSLQAVLGILVPEVESTVRAGRRESAVNRMERDVIDGIDIGDTTLGRITVALK